MSPAHRQRMSAVDTAWLRMDRPTNSMTIVGVTITAGRVALDDFRRLVAERLLRFERFRHRPLGGPLGAEWVEDEHFELDWHVQAAVLPQPGDLDALQALAAELAGTPLEHGRPMWQMHLVERYGHGSAWILRVHHCYADGVAMIRVLQALTDDASGRPLAEAPPPEGPHASPGEESATGDWLVRLLELGLRQALHPAEAAESALHASGMVGEFAKMLALPDDPPTTLRGAQSGRKAVAWAEPLSLEDVRTVGRTLDCTINDVLMATVAGALGAYLREQGASSDGLAIRAAVPVNLRGAEEPAALGNRFGMVFVELPVGLRNPLERLYAVHATMRRLKDSLQPPMVLSVLGALGLMPAPVQDALVELFSRKGTAVVSNVPGPRESLYVCGQRVEEMYFWVPQTGSMGVGISLLSYAGRVYVGMIADRALVPEPARVVARIVQEFEQLLLAVTVGALAAKERGGVRRKRAAGNTVARTKPRKVAKVLEKKPKAAKSARTPRGRRDKR